MFDPAREVIGRAETTSTPWPLPWTTLCPRCATTKESKVPDGKVEWISHRVTRRLVPCGEWGSNPRPRDYESLALTG